MIAAVFKEYDHLYKKFYEIGSAFDCSNIQKQDKEHYFDHKLWEHLSNNKVNGLIADEMFGGSNYSALATCVAFEALAYGCKNNGVLFSSIAHLLACVYPLNTYGNTVQKELFLAKLCSGNLIAANAVTELNSGSDVYNMSSVAIKENNSYILNGEKRYVTNAPISDILVVYALTDTKKGFFGGISCFIFYTKEKNIFITEAADKMGLHTAQMGTVNFNQVVLTEENRIGKPGAGGIIFSESMMRERVVVSALLIGQLERLFSETIKYAKNRKLVDRSLMDIQHIRHVLSDVKVIINAGKNMVYDAAFSVDNKRKDALSKTSAAKLFVSENAVNSIKQLQLIHGAYGYLAESGMEREYRDAYASLIYSGTSAIQRNIISADF